MRWEFIFDMIFPNTCVGCGCESTLLCSACAGRMQRAAQVCPVCEHASALGAAHAQCEQYALDMLAPVQIFSALSYHDPVVQAAVHDFKYQCVRGYAKVFAEIIFAELGRGTLPGTIITGVPMHPRKLAERGFNQSDLIARHLAVLLNAQHRPLLAKTKHTKSQTVVTAQQRREQQRGVFKCAAALHGEEVILVDDVCTTSSTLRECTRVLYEAGAGKVRCVTVAKD
jgi:ComF family protein